MKHILHKFSLPMTKRQSKIVQREFRTHAEQQSAMICIEPKLQSGTLEVRIISSQFGECLSGIIKTFKSLEQ